MKRKWLSALAIATAFAVVAVPGAALPNTAQAQTQEGAGEWDSFGVRSGYITTYYSGVQAITSGGGNLRVTLHRNDTGGTVYVRLTNAYGTVVKSGQAIYTGGSVTYYGIDAGSYMVEMKTYGSNGYVAWEVED